MVTIVGKSWDAQLLDQFAHLMAGIGLAVVLSTTVSALVAIPFVALIALIREFIQHKSFKIKWGSALDISFFIVGSIVWAATLI